MPYYLSMSETTTKGIRITVRSEYIADRSDPAGEEYFFAYHVNIQNTGDTPAQLTARHWIITDGAGRLSEVRGSGVVGEQPRLSPGESFIYTSACPLPTPVGTMHGYFSMRRDDGSEFDARIDPFRLAQPGALH